jgi:hypothetical protein
MGKFTGLSPTNLMVKSIVSCRFSQQNQSNDSTVYYPNPPISEAAVLNMPGMGLKNEILVPQLLI